MELVKSATSLRQTLELSAAASYSAGVTKADASASFFRSDNITTDSVYLVLDVQVTYESAGLDSVTLTEDALSKLKRDPALFIASCGDQFVSSMKRGGLFRAVYQFVGVSENRKNEISAKFSGAYANWSANSSFKQALEQTSSRYETRLYVLQSGGTLNAVGMSPAELIEQASTFGSTCADAYPIAIDTSPYYAATNFPAEARYPDITEQIDILGALSVDYDAVRIARNDVTQRLARPGRLDSPGCEGDKKKLADRKDELDEYLASASRKVAACQVVGPCGASAQCKKVLPVPDLELPRLDNPKTCGPACTDGNGSSYESDDRGYCTRCTFQGMDQATQQESADGLFGSTCKYMRRGADVVIRARGTVSARSCSPDGNYHTQLALQATSQPNVLGDANNNTCASACAYNGEWMTTPNDVVLEAHMSIGGEAADSSMEAHILQFAGLDSGTSCAGTRYTDWEIDICDADRPEGCAP